MEVWRTGFPKWGSQGGAVPPRGGRLRYVFYGKASKVPFRPRGQASKGEPPTFCRGQAPERLGLICGWLPGICPSGNGRRLTCRTSLWMPGIFRPVNLACSGGALAGCRAYRPGWCRKRGLPGYGGLADGISKVWFPRWGRSAVRGQASVRLPWQGFQGSVQPTGGRPPRWNPSTFNIIE